MKHLNRLITTLVMTATLFAPRAFAQVSDEPSPFHLGLAIGQLGLTGDPASKGANGLGYGFLIGYELESGLLLDLRLANTRRADVTHTEVTFGGEWSFDIEEVALWAPYVSGGVGYISNTLNVTAGNGDLTSVGGAGAGVYVGGGVEYTPNLQLSMGPEFRYMKGIESKTNVPGTSNEIKTVQDSYSIMFRVLYAISLEE